MGSKGSKTSTSTSKPPIYIENAIKNVLSQANKVNSLPLTQYSGPQLAGFSPLQQQGFDTIGNASNSWQTYFNNAQDLVNQGTQDTWSQVPEFNSENLSKYQNPYLNDVINNTINKMRFSDNEQQQDLTGDAIMSGAWGGSTAMDAKNNLARQQSEARNNTIADLMNNGYNTAVTNFMGDRNAQLSALQNTANTRLQGANQFTGMGTSNLNNVLNYVNGLSTAGGAQQAQEQKGLDISKSMFDAQQAYPYQQTQYLANLISAMSGGAGGTTTGTTPGQNNTMSTIGGLASIVGAFLKDGGRVPYKCGGGIKAYASGGMISPSDFTFIPASLNAPQAPQIQEDNSDQDAMGMLTALAGLGSGIKSSSSSSGGRTFGTPNQKWDAMDNLSSGARKDKAYAAKGGLGPYRFADGGQVNQPIMTEDTSYVPMTKGIKAYAFNPQAIAAMGKSVQTPLDVAKTATTAPTTAAKTNYMVGTDGKLYDTSNKNTLLNYLTNTVKGKHFNSIANNVVNQLMSGEKSYSDYGLSPLNYADGGMVDDRIGYADGGSTDDDILNSLAFGDSSLIPGITSAAGNPGIKMASLSAPNAPSKVKPSGGQIDMKQISDIIRNNGGMENASDLVSANQPTADSAEPTSSSILPSSEDKPVYENRFDEVLGTPWRAALLNAGATMLSSHDIGKGIAAGVAGYASVKKSKADAKNEAIKLAEKANQQKFENDLAKERLDIMRAGVNNRGSGSGRAPIDVSSKDMDSIEESALMMIPGVIQIDEKGRKSASEDALALIQDKRASARDVASEVYQQTRNADKAAMAYLQAIGIDPSSQEFVPPTQEENNWFSADKPAQDAQFKTSSKKALQDARMALKKGAPRDKVIQRLKDNGISPEGL